MNLAQASVLRAFLKEHGLSPNKGLGQHFLCSEKAVAGIVGAVDFCRGVVEIGPGPGILTGPLCDSGREVIALEVDERMIRALPYSAPKATIRKCDALEADLAAILAELPTPRAVVSNLPYFITGALLGRIAEAWASFDFAVLMMQKEVGERVMAAAGDSARGSLSVYLQARFEIRRLMPVPAGAFLPPPRVDSSVLTFKPLGREPGAAFDAIVRSAFTQPRKTLVNNLLGLGIERETCIDALHSVGLEERVRPHMLDMSDWHKLAEKVKL